MGIKKRVLVIDDDQAILRLLSSTLKLEGYNVVTATDGRSALTLLEERKPDLVILDIMMPGLSGFQVLELIRQDSNVLVLMLTVMNEVTAVRDSLALGADDYVRKPFNTRELLARIKAKLRRAENNPEATTTFRLSKEEEGNE